MKASDRKYVLVIGDRPLDERLFGIRSLVIKRIDNLEDATDALVSSACGVLLAEDADRLRHLGALTPERFRRLCQLGVLVGYLYANADSEARIRGFAEASQESRTRKGEPHWLNVHADAEQLAELFRCHDPGPGLGTAKIVCRDPKLHIPREHELLMRRAFFDASTLIIERLSGGNSADAAYRLYATFSTRPSPMPFVFKVGSPENIDDERNSYQQWVEPHIPFHLRPGLIRERNVTIPFHAALACNFVESASPLESVLVNRQGGAVIYSLFETTLRSLRAHTIASTPLENAIKGFIEERVDVQRIRKHADLSQRIDMAQSRGLSCSPEELQASLLNAADGMSARRGVYHGDLHIGNVMARHQDAIVIDFGSMKYEGPITADPACLEASIAFGTSSDELPDFFEEWIRFIESIYAAPLVPPPPSAEHFRFAWRNRAIRDVRHVAYCCAVPRKEALLVLAASLLRYARFSPNDFRDSQVQSMSEERKAYAMVISEKIYKIAITDAKSR